MSFWIAFNLTLGISILADRLVLMVYPRPASRSRRRLEVVVAAIAAVAALVVLYFAPAREVCEDLARPANDGSQMESAG
ncbi:hypothetical protein ACWDYH_37765 [Nocardia goodfellowii]